MVPTHKPVVQFSFPSEIKFGCAYITWKRKHAHKKTSTFKQLVPPRLSPLCCPWTWTIFSVRAF